MNSFSRDINHIFERNLRWRLRKKARTTAEQFQVLVNIFQYHDINHTGKINKDQWIQALYEEGLIDFSPNELNSLFEKYTKNETDPKLIDYKEFSFNFLFKNFDTKTPLITIQTPLSISSNKIKNYSVDTTKSANYKNVGNNYLNSFNSPVKNELSNSNILINSCSTPINMNSNISNINNTKNIVNNIINNNVNSINTDLSYQNNFNSNLSNQYSQMNTTSNNISNTELSNLPNNYIHITRNNMRIIINNFRNKINIKNGVTYYKFALKLKENSVNNTNEYIKIELLPLILQDIGIFYTQRELQSFTSLLTVNNSDNISITKMLELIKGNLNDYRKAIISDVFSNLLINTNDQKIDVQTLKKLYKPEMNPQVLTNKIDKDAAFSQFSETLDSYMKINNIENFVNLSQFIDYYSGISSSIYDDIYFKKFLYNVWGIIDNSDNNEKNLMNNKEINQSTREYKSSSVPKISTDNYELNKYKKPTQFNIDNDKSNTKINLPLFYYNNSKNLEKSINYGYNNSTSPINENKFGNNNNRYNSNQNYMNFDLNDINNRNEYK